MDEGQRHEAMPVTKRRPSPGGSAPTRPSATRPAHRLPPARPAMHQQWPPPPYDPLDPATPLAEVESPIPAQADPWASDGPGDMTLVSDAISGFAEAEAEAVGDVEADADADAEVEFEFDVIEPDAYPVVVRGEGAAIRTGRRRLRRTPVWAVLVIFVGSLLTVGGAGMAFAVQSLVNTVSKNVHQQDLLGDTVARDQTGGVSINGVINMLLVGIDTRASNPAMGSRADSIIIAHIPAGHDRVFLVSIPRDTDVMIPASPKTGFAGGEARINAAFQFGSMHGGGAAGGFQLLAKTIKSMYGISFQGGAIVNFDGFRGIVSKLGGVDMYVDETTTSLHYGFKTGTKIPAAPFSTRDGGLHWTRVPGVTPMIYHVGRQHLTPYQALDFVRIRDFLPNGDYDRERHQQQFIKAVLTEAYHRGLQNPLEAGSFLASISNAFVFSGGGVPIANWIFTLKGISPGSMLLLKVNNGTYNTLHVPRAGGGFDSREVMSAQSLTLMSDVAHDRVEQFVAANPSWVTASE